MGKTEKFQKKKLIIGVIYKVGYDLLPTLKQLENSFGIIDYRSSPVDFSYTRYYEPEMGSGLKKVFLSFLQLVDPEGLADIKIRTNDIESLFSMDNRREVNLDPGLLDQSRLLLATTKDNSHRIPLRRGIYAEVTLIYEKKEFRDLRWTYPDYRTAEYKAVLSEIRDIYTDQLKRRE